MKASKVIEEPQVLQEPIHAEFVVLPVLYYLIHYWF